VDRRGRYRPCRAQLEVSQVRAPHRDAEDASVVDIDAPHKGERPELTAVEQVADARRVRSLPWRGALKPAGAERGVDALVGHTVRRRVVSAARGILGSKPSLERQEIVERVARHPLTASRHARLRHASFALCTHGSGPASARSGSSRSTDYEHWREVDAQERMIIDRAHHMRRWFAVKNARGWRKRVRHAQTLDRNHRERIASGFC
jgi:hypothetical protein